MCTLASDGGAGQPKLGRSIDQFAQSRLVRSWGFLASHGDLLAIPTLLQVTLVLQVDSMSLYVNDSVLF